MLSADTITAHAATAAKITKRARCLALVVGISGMPLVANAQAVAGGVTPIGGTSFNGTGVSDDALLLPEQQARVRTFPRIAGQQRED